MKYALLPGQPPHPRPLFPKRANLYSYLRLDRGGRIGKPALSPGERVDRRRRFSAGAGRVRDRFRRLTKLVLPR
jgi:hypothetical protein